MELWNNLEELKHSITNSVEIKDATLTITNETEFRNSTIDKLVYNAVFNDSGNIKDAARWIIWEASQVLGCPSASIHELYMARARNEYQTITVPAINIRGLTYDVARTVARILKKLNAQACVFEIARSEIGYTKQSPGEYTAVVLSALIKEGYKGPAFLQGDHFQVKLKTFREDPNKAVNEVKDLIKESIEAGFYNIDIDTSTLVDLNQPTVMEQQRKNFETAAELTRLIRKIEPDAITVSIGGEIGEIGGKNSTVEELAAFVEGYNRSLRLNTQELVGISKIAVQTGTTHGGVPLPDGSVAEVKLDFNVLDKLGQAAREQFKIGGVVQHGASTLPLEVFDKFPQHQTLEIHLATGFQNIIYDHPLLPDELKNKVYNWLKENCSKERKEGQTDQQFYYTTRKKGFGPFKREWWDIPADIKDAIMNDLAKNFELIFEKLNIRSSTELVSKFISTPRIKKRIPEGL